MTKLSEDLAWRGLIKDTTFHDRSWLDSPKTFYLGADAGSADSLTVGNLAVFMLARRLLDAGWKTVLLMGGATSLVGDPGGKTEERALVSKEQVDANIEGVKAQVERLFAGKQFTLVNNYDWFKDVGYLQFLREVGKHYSMTELLQREYIAERIGEGAAGISYAEFSYSLVQAYDFWHLFKKHDVVLQIGGSDQWGNMIAGVPLIRRKEAAEAHAMSMPLVVDKTTGRKFGKSEAGAVWLDANKTSAFQFYQFWLNSGDLDAVDYLKIFTLLGRSEIEQIASDHERDTAQRLAQKRLAHEVTKVVHGSDLVERAEQATAVITGETAIEEADDATIALLRREIPHAQLASDASLVSALVESGLVGSNSEARRLLAGGAIYVNGASTAKETLDVADFKNGRLLLRRGKALKDTALIERV